MVFVWQGVEGTVWYLVDNSLWWQAMAWYDYRKVGFVLFNHKTEIIKMLDFTTVFASNQMQIILVLLTVDVALGLVGAIVKKDFRFGKVAAFMKGSVLGYVLGYAVLALALNPFPALSFVLPVAFLLIVVALVASLFRNLNRLGLPLPGSGKM